MDNHNKEEEKLTKMRQSIREIILPLLADMYNNDPTDVMAFCCDYFNDLSQRRIVNANHLDTQDFKYIGEASHKNKEAVENTDEEIPQKYPNLQGSSSEPLLTSEKSGKGMNLRETSSWILPPKHPYLVGSSRVALLCNSASAMPSIDDQQSPKDEEIEFENTAEAGDTIAIQKEEKSGESNTYVESEISSQIMSSPTTREVQGAEILPSAPAYENFDQTFKELPKKKDTESPKHDKHSDAVEETKIYYKNVSPNSSCGFIPHLSEDYSEEEFIKSNSESCDDLASPCSKTTEDIQKLTKRLSATLQSLAQDFRSAEINFNEQFQNAKEISDVVQGRLETKEVNEYLALTRDSDEANDDNDGRMGTVENAKFMEADLNEANENNRKRSIDKNVFEPEFTKSSEKLNKSSALEVTDGSTNETSRNFQEDRHAGTVKDSSQFRNSRKSDQSDDSMSSQDPNESDSNDSSKTIYESWRKRWYEVHPLLDSKGDGLKQQDSIWFGGCNIVDRNRRNEAIHRIGEAGGDISKRSGRNPFTTEDLTESSASSLEPSHSEVAYTDGEQQDSSNVSADEILDIRRRVRPSASRNLSDKDIPLSIPSQSKPYSWRYMCKPRVSSLERKVKDFKPTPKKVDENLVSGKGDRKELNADTRASHEPGNESAVVIGSGEVNEIVSSNPHQSNPSTGMVEKSEESEIHEISEDNASRSKESMNCGNKNKDESHCFNTDKPTSSDNECSVEGTQIKFQGNNDDSCINEEAEIVIYNDTGRNENTQNESSEKIEPGLLSAGGDFAVSLINGNNEQNIMQLPIRRENIMNNMEQNWGVPREEGSEEMIEVGTERQNEDSLDYSFEGLNFSTCSESDRSIGYSDTEDDYDSTENI